MKMFYQIFLPVEQCSHGVCLLFSMHVYDFLHPHLSVEDILTCQQNILKCRSFLKILCVSLCAISIFFVYKLIYSS